MYRRNNSRVLVYFLDSIYKTKVLQGNTLRKLCGKHCFSRGFWLFIMHVVLGEGLFVEFGEDLCDLRQQLRSASTRSVFGW